MGTALPPPGSAARQAGQVVIIGSTPGRPAASRTEADMTLDDDMTTPPEEPDSGTPADAAAGTNTDYTGGPDGGGDGGADGGDDPTTETEDDPRFA
jgi:hypothetical protein